jgi:hypothetical protein
MIAHCLGARRLFGLDCTHDLGRWLRLRFAPRIQYINIAPDVPMTGNDTGR